MYKRHDIIRTRNNQVCNIIYTQIKNGLGKPKPFFFNYISRISVYRKQDNKKPYNKCMVEIFYRATYLFKCENTAI